MNYWRIKKKWGDTKLRYAILDTPQHLAKPEFLKQGIRVDFEKKAMSSPDRKYRVAFVKINPADEQKFFAAMDALYRKMLIMGHTDYPSMCTHVQHILDGDTK